MRLIDAEELISIIKGNDELTDWQKLDFIELVGYCDSILSNSNNNIALNNIENISDMIKALKCLGSMASSGDCYADLENFNHLSDKKFKKIVCTSSETPVDPITGKGGTRCPYHQDTYGVCVEDGETHWLSETAELIESIPDMLKKEYSRAIEDFVNELDQTAGYYSGENKNITREDVLKIAQKLNDGHL